CLAVWVLVRVDGPGDAGLLARRRLLIKHQPVVDVGDGLVAAVTEEARPGQVAGMLTPDGHGISFPTRSARWTGVAQFSITRVARRPPLLPDHLGELSATVFMTISTGLRAGRKSFRTVASCLIACR